MPTRSKAHAPLTRSYIFGSLCNGQQSRGSLMEDPGQACTCWNIETDNGEPAKMGWLRLHDSVRLVTRDGTSAEGWTHGVDRRRMGGI